MPIVTISRGTFAGGLIVAETLASRLGLRLVSREDLHRCVQAQYGFTAEELTSALDQAPTRFDRSGEQRRRLFVAVQATLCDLIKDGQVVYHGQTGHLLLTGIEHVLRVRLIAPRERRIELAQAREQLSPYEAGRRIDQVDTLRSRWSQFFFGVDWADPSLYDLVLNLERLSPEDAAECVALALTRAPFRPSPDSRRKLADLALASRVRARLLLEPATADLDFKIEADNGTVRLSGLLCASDLPDLTRFVRTIEGVEQVVTSSNPIKTNNPK